jgi:hypothetical protein
MAILKESMGDTLACDGCGRTDAGPSQALHVQPYTVHDPNVGSGVLHHYCAGCAANRGLTDPIATIAGWEAAPAPTEDAAE